MKREPPQAGPSSDAGLSGEPIPQPPAIPDHELIRRIGGGSYGEVWLARNALGAYRAVKIVSRATFEHERPFEREFAGIQKFEPISRSHEGLVDLLQVGRNDAKGYFYYVMELADGEEMQNEECKMKNEAAINPTANDCPQSLLNFEFSILNYRPKTLRSLLRPDSPPSILNPPPATRLPLDECIQLGLSLTNALAYLHGHGLVHRDIKPSNIIFVGGVPKLADVGLVTGVDEARSYVGTEGFIPPEGPGSPQADLYSLGILLYVMSTGKSHQDFPEPLADFAGQPDHARWLEFNAVIHKACRAEVRERYQTAERMHADLELLQVGKSVKQRQVWEQRWAWSKKAGVVITLVSIVVAAFLIAKYEFTHRSTEIKDSITTFENSGTKDREAYNAYSMGRFYWWKRTADGLTNAITQFEKAIRLDTNFARAYAGLADSYDLLDSYAEVAPEEIRPKAHAAVLRALELDPKLAEVQTSLAKFQLVQERDWAGAEQAFREALKLDTNYALAHFWYADYLAAMGQCEDAIRECRRAVELEPTSLIFNNTLGLHLLYARDYESAITQYRKTVAMDPYFPEVHHQFGLAYYCVGQNEEAIAEFEKYDQLMGENLTKVAARRAAYQVGGMPAYWRKRAEQMKEEFAGRSPPVLGMAKLCAVLGEVDDAFVWLYRAYDERRDDLKYLNVHPIYDPLRSDPRFGVLLKRMGLEKTVGNP